MRRPYLNIFSLAILLLPLRGFADPAAPGPSIGTPPGAPPPNVYVTVSHLGDPAEQAALREGQLLSHRRATDPFGNTIRGPYKALPLAAEHPSATPAQSTAATPLATPANLPTIEKAVQELGIGAVNVEAHEMLVGSRSIREGDLLVLESGGRQFVVWVQNIGVRGVMFCDIEMQKHFSKSFGSGPKELPPDSVRGVSDLRQLLHKDSPP